MAKLRHIAMAVPDLEAAAAFYEKTFELERVKQTKKRIYLSDGTV
jgi:catechol 2,3-dioxygenase-like lactoylglutathione lyase family enzyme